MGFHAPCAVEKCEAMANYSDVIPRRPLCERHRVLEKMFEKLLEAEDPDCVEKMLLANHIWEIVDEKEDPEEMLETVISSLNFFRSFIFELTYEAVRARGAVSILKEE